MITVDSEPTAHPTDVQLCMAIAYIVSGVSCVTVALRTAVPITRADPLTMMLYSTAPLGCVGRFHATETDVPGEEEGNE